MSITTFSFNEDHGNWGEYLDLKPDIADGKTNRGYWVRNMYPIYFLKGIDCLKAEFL